MRNIKRKPLVNVPEWTARGFLYLSIEKALTDTDVITEQCFYLVLAGKMFLQSVRSQI